MFFVFVFFILFYFSPQFGIGSSDQPYLKINKFHNLIIIIDFCSFWLVFAHYMYMDLYSLANISLCFVFVIHFFLIYKDSSLYSWYQRHVR